MSYGAPENFSPAEIAVMDQYCASAREWLRDALTELRSHVTHVHDGDVRKCQITCGSAQLFANIESLTETELVVVALAAFHELLHVQVKLDTI